MEHKIYNEGTEKNSLTILLLQTWTVFPTVLDIGPLLKAFEVTEFPSSESQT